VKRLGLLLVVVAAGCGGDSAIDSEPDFSEPAAMTLRLSDLPPGFRYGGGRTCGPIGTTEGQEPKLDEFLIASHPRTCFDEFSREWGGEPASVQAVLFLFDSEADAERAWELRTPLLARFARIFITLPRGSGDEIAFDSEGVLKPGAGEAWRDDRLVVAVYEEGLAGRAGRSFARDLAVRQRSRIESPSDPSGEDERELGLEDPAIPIPVYWLGREYEPPGLPKLRLSSGEYARGGGPGNEAKIDYEGEGGGVTLELWTPEAWKRFASSRFGRRCDQHRLSADGVRAELYNCRGQRDRWLAHVSEPGVVIAVEGSGPYNSRRGLEAAVAGLRRR
jgi:hypothetical protein